MIVVMQLIAMLLACGYGLIAMTNVERKVAWQQRAGAAEAYAADAAVERALVDILSAPDFTAILSGSHQSTFRIGGLMPVLPDGSPVSLTALTNEVQAITDADMTWGGDRPRWMLFAFGPINDLAGTPGISRPEYLVAWVADDRADGDNDPGADANGSLMVLGRAYGVAGSRTMEVVIRHQAVVSWREWQ